MARRISITRLESSVFLPRLTASKMLVVGIASEDMKRRTRDLTPPSTVSPAVAGGIRSGRLEEASSVLLHDPRAYPPAWNQPDALARACEQRGNNGEALRLYELSPRANPKNEFARKKLAELGANPTS